ncbi:MAG: DUF1553 domain-containing protein, partial [Rhodocyclaceae bacterium]|nr:DUF1553 domain-containing protein [Rhodocyclaceae bacterium]
DQQSSMADSAKIEADPRKLLLSRGPRVRLSAEQIRDQALAGSGLLDEETQARLGKNMAGRRGVQIQAN